MQSHPFDYTQTQPNGHYNGKHIGITVKRQILNLNVLDLSFANTFGER